MQLPISELHFAPATGRDRATGMVGYISFVLAGRVRIDGVVARRTRDGRLALAWPGKPGAGGRKHYYARPVDEEARRELEGRILGALDLGGGDA